MTYQQTLDFLYNQVPMFQNLGAGAYKPGLDTTLLLAGHWDNPHKKLKATVHIGGTNGKGSTAHQFLPKWTRKRAGFDDHGGEEYRERYYDFLYCIRVRDLYPAAEREVKPPGEEGIVCIYKKGTCGSGA